MTSRKKKLQEYCPIVITIGFSPEDGSPARVFERAAGIIKSLEKMDSVFAQSISSQIETTFILEDIQRSSIKVFLKNALKSVDDDALKDLDWKKQVGAYLVKAKYAAIEWLDQEDAPTPISDLTEKIASLAEQTNVRRLPDYPQPDASSLARTLDGFQEEKAKFHRDDSLTITLEKSEYRVNLGSTWSPSEVLEEESVDREIANEMDMYLIIRKPDMLGETRWQFRHGKSHLSLAIEDEIWLEKFHSGETPIKPGDALAVRIRSSHKYNSAGDLIKDEMVIIKVYDVKSSSSSQPSLFDKNP